jgi:Fe-S cluster assembly ATPase SufC
MSVSKKPDAPKAGGFTTKVTSLRISEELFIELRTVARIEGVTNSELVRAALYRYIAKRRTDPEFRAQVKARLDRERAIMERMVGEGVETGEG